MPVLITSHGLLDDPTIRKVVEKCFDKVVFMRSDPVEDFYMVASTELDEMGAAPNDGVNLSVSMLKGIEPFVSYIETYKIRR